MVTDSIFLSFVLIQRFIVVVKKAFMFCARLFVDSYFLNRDKLFVKYIKPIHSVTQHLTEANQACIRAYNTRHKTSDVKYIYVLSWLSIQ